MGKNTMRLDLIGFSTMLEGIQKAGGNIERAVETALTESAKPFETELKAGIAKHHRTGLTEKSLLASNNVQWDGNRATLNVGFDIAKGGLPALFIEYGTPRMPADPFIQPAIQRNQSKAKKIQQQVLNEILEGIEK